MVMLNAHYAQLNQDQLQLLQSLEGELGKIVLAIEPGNGPAYANLSEAQVKQIQKLEEDLGVVLLAYRQPR